MDGLQAKQAQNYRRTTLDERNLRCYHCAHLCQIDDRTEFNPYRCTQLGTGRESSYAINPMTHTCDQFEGGV